MRRTSKRTTAPSAAAAITVGLGTVLWGVWKNDPARATGGACLTITALALIGLVLIRGWITDTSAERSRLATAARAKDEERLRYLAGQATQNSERDRMRRDMEYAVERAAAQLRSEQAKLRAEIDAERNALICATFASAYEILKVGFPTRATTRGRAVIPFPAQQPAGSGERARGRDVSR